MRTRCIAATCFALALGLPSTVMPRPTLQELNSIPKSSAVLHASEARLGCYEKCQPPSCIDFLARQKGDATFKPANGSRLSLTMKQS